jgi:hypothetical protein
MVQDLKWKVPPAARRICWLTIGEQHCRFATLHQDNPAQVDLLAPGTGAQGDHAPHDPPIILNRGIEWHALEELFDFGSRAVVPRADPATFLDRFAQAPRSGAVTPLPALPWRNRLCRRRPTGTSKASLASAS